MALSRVDHVRQLNQRSVPELVGVVAGLRGVLCASCDEDSAIVRLDRAKPDRNVEVDVQHFSLLALVVHIVESHYFLIELEEVNFVCADFFHLVLVLLGLRSIQHSYASLREIVGHCELRVSVEADVLHVLADLLVVDAIDVVLGSTVVALGSSGSVAVSM